MAMAGDGGGKKARNKKRSKRKMASEQALASKYICDWAFPPDCGDGDFLPLPRAVAPRDERMLFELHCHSNCSDGYLSPKAVVDRAHRNGVSPGLKEASLLINSGLPPGDSCL